MVGSATPVNSAIFYDSSVDQMCIAAIGALGNNAMDGHLDELRVTKGVARYASDGGFAVPTAAYPRGGL
jgi:hypothetical protein